MLCLDSHSGTVRIVARYLVPLDICLCNISNASMGQLITRWLPLSEFAQQRPRLCAFLIWFCQL